MNNTNKTNAVVFAAYAINDRVVIGWKSWLGEEQSAFGIVTAFTLNSKDEIMLRVDVLAKGGNIPVFVNPLGNTFSIRKIQDFV